MPYSDVADLYIGDLTLGANTDPAKFIADAEREINAKLGMIYLLPLEPDTENGFQDIPEFTMENLEKLSNWLASGRLILTLNSTSGEDTLNAYGAMLVKDAQSELEAIHTGLQDLVGVKRAPARNAAGDSYNGPTLVNHDAASAVDTFYAGVMQGVRTGDGLMPGWKPGV